MPTYTFTGFSPSDLTVPSTGQIRLTSNYDSTVAYSFEITDDDSTWSGDSASNSTPDDATQQTTVVRDGTGAVVVSGRSYLEYTKTAVDGYGNSIDIFRVMIGTTTVGYVANGQVVPGNTYDFVETDITPSNEPTYTSIVDQTFDPDLQNDMQGTVNGDYQRGYAGNDSLYGWDGDDTLEGWDGDDLVDGGDGNDILYGWTGNDTVLGGAGNDSILGGTGNDSLLGGTGDDTILGETGTDSIFGGTGNDSLDGGGDADTFYIENSFGSDTIIGGETGTDSDTINLTLHTTSVTVTFTSSEAGTITNGTDTLGFSEIEEFVLTGGADYLFHWMSSAGITVYAGGGEDTINASNGNDLIHGEDGNDRLDGGTGNDTLYGGAGNDTLTGNTGDDVIFAGDGDDIIWTSGGFDSIAGGAGSDTFAVTSSGNDFLFGDEDADKFNINDGAGNVTIEGGEGVTTGTDADLLDLQRLTNGVTVTLSTSEAGTAFDGTDTVTFSEIESFNLTNRNDSVDASAATSGTNIIAGAGNDSILGGVGADTITGGDGDDYIDGGDGDDVLFTGEGQDTLFGGAGNDTLSNSDGDDSLDGGAGDDSITATGGQDTLRGGTGADTMDGGDDADTFIIEDNFGNDVIIGGEGTTAPTDKDFDTIDMSTMTGPVTVLYTGDEAGTITNGTDTITFSEIERLILTDQADVVDASADNVGVDIVAGAGNDTITDSEGDDHIDAGDGDDYVAGNDGNDTILGGSGNDDIEGGGGDDSIDGGDGDDYLAGFDVSGLAAHTGNVGSDDGSNDTLIGGAGNDTLLGGGGNDALTGDEGADSIVGGDGDDTLIGGTGDDTLTGGGGDDTFTYNVGDGADTITDFNAGNTGALGDGDTTNNDFIDLGGFYDNLTELHEDFNDDGVLNQSNSTSNGGTVDYSDNDEMQSQDGLTFQGADQSSFTADNTGVVCFTTGTAIRTPRGDALIEDLKVGDLVTTMDNGPQRIAWIGQRHVTHSQLLQNDWLHPVLIKNGVLGAQRDLLVSRQHGMLMGQDHFGRAVHLAKTVPGIRVANGKRQVTYVHLMFEAHQVIFAEGIPSESFYPGPMALEMLNSAALKEMQLAFPQLTASIQREDILAAYGGTARVFLENKTAVSERMSEGTDVVKSEIRKWDVDLAMERFESERMFGMTTPDQNRKSARHRA